MGKCVQANRLLDFCRRVFLALELSEEDAEIAAVALVSTDLRGIDSHGVAHLGRYVRGLQDGSLNPRPSMQVLSETPSTALLDGDCGFGYLVANRAMGLAIAKAKAAGSGWVVARKSTHFGAAGHWAGMALSHGLIGFAMTTSASRIAPTFGACGMLGTNPIAMAVPADQEAPFLLDMATCVVPMGRLEIYSRLGKSLPAGWVIDSSGEPITDPAQAFEDAIRGKAFLVPLGGCGEMQSGYKGYGLSLGVEILCNILAGYAGPAVASPGRETDMGQFFGALSIEAFRPIGEFAMAMDHRLREFKDAPPLPGEDRVLVAGQREFETMQDRMQHGIPLHDRVLEELESVGSHLDIAFEVE